MDNLQEIWATIKLGVFGMIGATFMSLYNRGKVGSWKDAGIYIFFGGLIAQFGAPIIVWLFSIQADIAGSISFFLGSIGGTLAKWAWHFIEDGELTALIKANFKFPWGN